MSKIKKPNPKKEYINILGIDSAHKVPKYAIVTNVKKHITQYGKHDGYTFTYNGKQHWVHYPWALVENTPENRKILDEIDKYTSDKNVIELKLKNLRSNLIDLKKFESK